MTQTASVIVTRVEKLPTQHGAALDRYRIGVRRMPSIDPACDHFSVSTVDPFQADLCQHAKDTGRTILLTWGKSKYWDQDLVSVWFPPEQEKTAS